MIYIYRKTHRDLCNTVIELNKTFGIQLHLSLALSICLVAALLYDFYVFSIKSIETQSVLLEIVLSMWISFYACKVFLIIHVGETTTHEVQKNKKSV